MERTFRTSDKDRAKSKAAYHAKKAQDPDWLAKMRAYKSAWRKRTGKDRGRQKKWKKSVKAMLCHRARQRGRERGLEATVSSVDLHWPTHCPVLGIALDYETERGHRHKASFANLPSLDRWDNAKGYVKGNVYVISARANALKGSATADELALVAHYARHGVPSVGKPEPELTGPVES